MIKLFRFSPSRLALVYITLSVLVLALFAVPLWYGWRVNLATFREYVQGEDMQLLVEVFDREGAKGVAAAMESLVRRLPSDRVAIFTDASKLWLAGNLPAWPAEVPDAPGTYGLVITMGGEATMRVVASHVRLPGGYHLMMGRESVRFESLVERFWYGIAGAMGIVLLLGAGIGWLSHRALLSEVQEISSTASAIVEGDLSRRVAIRGGSDELDTLAQTVNGMLERLARQNARLEGEIAVRRQAEAALHGAREDLEELVAQRTAQLARANESLRQSEDYLAEGQRLSLTGSFGWSLASGETYWSQETFRIFGYDPAARATFALVLQRTYPEDRALVRQAIERASQERKGFDFEQRLLMPDGAVKYLRVVGHPVTQGESGNVEFVGAVTDITERKRLEGQLLEDQKRFRLLSESSLSGIYLIQEGRFRYVNPAMAQMFGYEVEEVVDRLGPLDLTYPDDRDIVGENIRRRIEGEVDEIHYDFRGVRKDGTLFYIEVHGRRIQYGGKIGVIGTAVDITQRKRAEEERQAHLWFLESMDQINRAIQGTNDLEQMMSDVLDAVLAIFNCDRAWLVYPCDPEAASWKVLMEHARPEFPGAFTLGVDFPVNPDIAKVLRTVRASGSPVRFDAGSEPPLPGEAAERFSIQSMIAMALYAKGDKPYMLGLHQCSYPRGWTPQEERLFQEIGRRLEDALTGLLIFRNLGESERKLEEAQRLTHVGHWESDTDTYCITWSDETYRIFGLEPQTRILNFADLPKLIHPEDRQIMVKAVEEALQGGQRYDVEYRVVRPDGEVRLVHSQGDVMRDESGRPRRMFGTAQDITERKQAEQRLKAQNTVTQLLAEAATLEEVTPKILRTVCEFLSWDLGALWSVDRTGEEMRCVEVWHKNSVNAPQFETISRESSFVHGTGLPGRVWSSREPAYIPDVVHDANFPRASVAAREGLHAAFGFPILLGGEVLGVMEFFSHDIRQPQQDLLNTMATVGSQIGQFIERKRAEDALRHAQMDLTHVARVSTLGVMTASIAHEINQPLAAVVNNASACLRWLAAQNLEEARQSAALVIADGHRAGEIIARIRALAKKTPPRKEWLDINETIREVIALARSEVQRSGVVLETRLSDDVHYLPLVLADRIQLQQVILNLIVNAIEAMSETVDGERDLLVRSAIVESRRVLVAVRDSGPGLDPKSLEHLFDAFYTTKPQGMGMGLAISRSIIEALGGKLWASANQDGGATFQFTLPTGGEAP
jgi:PAS domain S-box-containing protein